MPSRPFSGLVLYNNNLHTIGVGVLFTSFFLFRLFLTARHGPGTIFNPFDLLGCVHNGLVLG